MPSHLQALGTPPARRRPHGRPFLLQALLCLTVLPWCTVGCKDLSVASSNLDALLDENDHLRHVAPVRSGLRYYFETVIDPRWFGRDAGYWKGREVVVPDPSTTALGNLLVLAKGRGAKPAHRQIIQVRQFSRYAVRSPGVLVRERAVLELAPHAQRLGLTDLSSVLTQPIEQVDLANGAELSTLLAGLIDTIEPIVRQGSQADETACEDFALACQQVEVERMELDGLWRMLKALETFAARVDLDRELFAPLRDLSERLQRRSVALALAGTGRDPAPRVRAASLWAMYQAFGPEVLAEALVRLREELPPEPDQRFGLAKSQLAEGLVIRKLAQLLGENGWPERAALTPRDGLLEEFQDHKALLVIVNEGAFFESHSRVTIMQALQKLVPDGPRSLREEDWVAWWNEWSQAILQRIQEMDAGQGASTAP